MHTDTHPLPRCPSRLAAHCDCDCPHWRTALRPTTHPDEGMSHSVSAPACAQMSSFSGWKRAATSITRLDMPPRRRQ
eukprot:1462377-Prymnesium_polylepis.2